MRALGRRRPARALRWAIGLATLGVVISLIDVTSLGARLGSANHPLAAIALGGLAAVHLIGALSWQRLTERLAGVRLAWPPAVRLYYAAQTLGALTPANLGSDAFRIAALDPKLGRRRIAVPIVAQRVTSVAALVTLGGLGAIALPIAGFAWFGFALLAVVGLLGGIFAVGLGMGPGLRLGMGGLGIRLSGFAQRIGLDAAVLATAAARSSFLRDGFGLALLFHASALILGLMLVAAVDHASVARPGLVLAALAVARLSLAVPLSPSGIGIQEGVLAVIFVQLGLTPEAAVAATLMNRLALLLTAVIGSVAILRGSGATSGAEAGPMSQPAVDAGPRSAEGAAPSGINAARTIASRSSLDEPARARSVRPRPRVTR